MLKARVKIQNKDAGREHGLTVGTVVDIIKIWSEKDRRDIGRGFKFIHPIDGYNIGTTGLERDCAHLGGGEWEIFDDGELTSAQALQRLWEEYSDLINSLYVIADDSSVLDSSVLDSTKDWLLELTEDNQSMQCFRRDLKRLGVAMRDGDDGWGDWPSSTQLK